jgi:hypothetical protein
MFKGFLPKIAAIPASALPIALLGSVGHVPLDNGIIQEQPASVRVFIRIVIVYVPSALSFISFYLKLQFPLKTQAQNDLITEGIALHLIGQTAKDACSGIQYRAIDFDNVPDKDAVDLVDYFPGLSVAQGLLNDPDGYSRTIFKKAILQLVLSIVWLIVSLITAVLTFDMLRGDMQYIPVLAIVGFGLGITMILFSSLRLYAANELKNGNIPGKATLRKIVAQRQALGHVQRFETMVWPLRKKSVTNVELVAKDAPFLGDDMDNIKKKEEGQIDTKPTVHEAQTVAFETEP